MIIRDPAIFPHTHMVQPFSSSSFPSPEELRALSPDQRMDAVKSAYAFASPIVERFRNSTTEELRRAISGALSKDEAVVLQLLLGLRDN